MATALIAEDEPLLARALAAELAHAWPGLQVLASVPDGASAVASALALRPDVLFFDIRMPGMNGLEAATVLAEDWDTAACPFPQLVFVTAYDQYAVDAFEHQAVDYVLKPVRAERLAKTVERVQQRLAARAPAAGGFGPDQWASLQAALALAAAPAQPALPRLSVLQVATQSREGSAIRLLPLAEVLYFEAADKYVRVLTAGHEYLIRTPIKDLLPQLDPAEFWQVHRSTVVRASVIEQVLRDEAGKQSLRLRGHPDTLVVSRLYSHLFKAM